MTNGFTRATVVVMTPLRKTLLFLPLALMACASLPKEANVEPAKKSSTATTAAPALKLTAASMLAAEPTTGEDDDPLGLESPDEEPDLSAEDFAEGFCTDDVYATYLTSKYHAEHPHKYSPSAKRSAKTSLRSKDLEALSYAKKRMSGATTPYYGAIPVAVNQHVDFWIQYFKSSGRREFMRWLVRGESVKPLVQPILQESGIPIEFFYLAMVESGFSNGARSHKRATGTWQFMRGTAELYGLRINHWVDERRDPIKSTLAAAAYLRDLYQEFGDWHLAMAAYNSGPTKVRRAIRRTGTRDFWKLVEARELSKETSNYVPKVLAAILLAAEAKRHGFDFKANPIDSLPETEVIVKHPVRLDELAKELGVPVRMLHAWNPELIKDLVPPSKNGYSLRLSSPYAALFPQIEQRLTMVEVSDVHMHTVRQGDTLSRIAKRYNVGVKQILSVNPELKASQLRIGRAIAVPVPGVISRS